MHQVRARPVRGAHRALDLLADRLHRRAHFGRRQRGRHDHVVGQPLQPVQFGHQPRTLAQGVGADPDQAHGRQAQHRQDGDGEGLGLERSDPRAQAQGVGGQAPGPEHRGGESQQIDVLQRRLGLARGRLHPLVRLARAPARIGQHGGRGRRVFGRRAGRFGGRQPGGRYRRHAPGSGRPRPWAEAVQPPRKKAPGSSAAASWSYPAWLVARTTPLRCASAPMRAGRKPSDERGRLEGRRPRQWRLAFSMDCGAASR